LIRPRRCSRRCRSPLQAHAPPAACGPSGRTWSGWGIFFRVSLGLLFEDAWRCAAQPAQGRRWRQRGRGGASGEEGEEAEAEALRLGEGWGRRGDWARVSLSGGPFILARWKGTNGQDSF
jgi:hypothetical protein